MMPVNELVVWAGMAGAIAVLCLVVTVDWLVQRTAVAARGLVFVVMTGGASVVMSGLPEQIFPWVNPDVVLPLKVALGPLSGALALGYLGIWLGAGRDDPLTRWTVHIGSALCVVLALGLAFLADVRPPLWSRATLLAASGTLNLGVVLLGGFVTVRGALLGDALARWMVVACGFLAVMVVGLYAKGLNVPGLGLGFWIATACSVVAYFLFVIWLTMQRNREIRRLRGLAQGLSEQEFDIPMPQGSRLLPKVQAAVWRCQHLDRPCVIAAIAVRNLYALGDDLGHGVEAEILAVLAARIRRHVGFRNVVGLYHPRCFVLAVSSGQDPRRGELLAVSLLQSVRQRVRVGPPDHRFDFWPSVGMGVVDLRVMPMPALSAINRAEQLALEDQDLDDLMSSPLDGDSLPIPL